MSVAPATILDGHGRPASAQPPRSAARLASVSAGPRAESARDGLVRVSAPRSVDAPRVVRFSSATSSDNTGTSYYDAAATSPDVDFGAWRSGLFEDLHFTGATRRIVLARVRREVRNNPYLAGLVAKYPEAIGHTSLRSRTSSRDYNLAKEAFWYRWSRRASIDGRSLRKVEKLVVQELLLAGELFIILLASGRLQLVASEFCGSPGGGSYYGERECNGIVSDSAGRPASYRFGKLTRHGTVEFTGKPDELVDARFVVHVYDPDRVLMGRGLPWLLASIKTARDLYEICRSKTKQIKDANSLSGFITSNHSPEILTGLRPPPISDDDTGSTTTTAETQDSPADPPPSAATAGGLRLVELKPGVFFALDPGESVESLMSEYHASDYKELIMLMLHAISTPVGLPVELWFSGLGDVNYSGFKGLGVQWKSRREYVCGFLEETFLDRLQFWRVMKAQKEGDILDIKTGQPVDNPDKDDDLIHWGWKRAAVLDDEKSAKANQVRLDSGEACLADIWSEGGEFAEEVLAKRRQLWINGQIAAGELDPAADNSKVKVPLSFLFANQVPGVVKNAAPIATPADPNPEDNVDPAQSSAAA